MTPPQKAILDSDLFIPTGIPASADQVRDWLLGGEITEEVFESLVPEQRDLEVVDEALEN